MVLAVTSEERFAIQTVEEGDGGAHQESVALATIVRAHERELWLGCDCRREGGRRPVAAPCRRKVGTVDSDEEKGTYYWRVLGAPQLEHDKRCVFYRSHMRRTYEERWRAQARAAPGGYMSVLGVEVGEKELSKGRCETGSGRGGGDGRPALSRWLLRLMAEADLNRVRLDAEVVDGGDWSRRLREVTKRFEIAPGRALNGLWFPFGLDWQKKRVHARVHAAARIWPEGYRVQGFLCWVVWDVDSQAVGVEGRWDRVEVVKRVRRPTVGRNAVPGPYVFVGVVGLGGPRKGVQCMEGYAQPIVAKECPVPVDSHYERRAFGTLRANLRALEREFEGVEFELEKPVFDIATEMGACLPDFLVRATRDDEEVVFVVEVMGFERPSYLKGKEETHPRMERVGILCKMDAVLFDKERDGVKMEGRRVANSIRGVLQRKWGGG